MKGKVKNKRLIFLDWQEQFTRHVRDPENQVLLPGLDAERAAIYRDLIFSNVSNSFKRAFPIIFSIVDTDSWKQLMRHYLVKHSAKTPFFHQLAGEFSQYLLNFPQHWEEKWPFLGELGHYEYAELRLSFSEEQPFADKHEDKGSPTHTLTKSTLVETDKPIVSPLAWVLTYRYPVHKISADYQPKQSPDNLTYLIVYRDRTHRIRFMEINAFTAQLMAFFQQHPGQVTVKQALVEVSVMVGEGDHLTVIMGQGLSILRSFKRGDILL